MSLEQNLDKVVSRYKDIGGKLSQADVAASKDYVKLSKEYSDLTSVVEAINAFKKIKSEIEDLKALVADPENDAEMRTLAEEELVGLNEQLPVLEHDIQLLLLPKDEADEKNAILEVRAGTGGEEAALFAASLFRLYQRFAEGRKWKFEIMNVNETGIGGYKEAVASITGRDVFARLKFESGVHRVQRVPETESSGRIHTSAATVAVMPESEDVDVHIEDKDLRIDVFRASGPGGQSVNTTDSAVRITHIPTGIVVSQQDEKSQHKNRAKGMRVLRSRLYEHERQIRESERAANRKSQVGSGDRSERIRTYNYPQGRVTDHRIGLTLHKLDRVMDGELDELIDALTAEDQAHRLAAIE